MLNFAKQSEEINGTLNTDMKVPRALCRHTNVGFPVFINLRHCLLLAASDHGAWCICISEFCLFYRRLDLNFKPKFLVWSFQSWVFFALSVVVCSFEETGFHQKWRQEEQLIYCHQTRQKAGCVSFSRLTVSKRVTKFSQTINKAFLILKLLSSTPQVNDSNKSVIKVQTSDNDNRT